MIFCNLGSGSKGNCTYIEHENTGIFIDQGFSAKNVTERMTSIGLDPLKVNSIILTHEHSDHSKGLGVFGRKYNVPVYLTDNTYSALKPDLLKNVNVNKFTAGQIFNIGSLKVKTFHTPHDAIDPIGIVVSTDKVRVGIVTDMGDVRQSVVHHLTKLDLLLLESNHDPVMLKNGSYPLKLKQRIKSRVGHLSNQQSIELFNKISNKGELKHLILGHLSEENNDPQIINKLFKENGGSDCKYSIEIASQEKPGSIYKL